MKKVLILNGSPRKNGNTETMLNAFIKQAKNNKHKVIKYDIAKMNIEGCKACNYCYKHDTECISKDDFNKISPKILEADTIIFGFPVYWYTLPSQIKALLDKFYALIPKEEINNKEYALISCCGEPDMKTFKGSQIVINSTATFFKGWKSIGEILIPNVNEVGDINQTNGIQLAKELANKL